MNSKTILAERFIYLMFPAALFVGCAGNGELKTDTQGNKTNLIEQTHTWTVMENSGVSFSAPTESNSAGTDTQSTDTDSTSTATALESDPQPLNTEDNNTANTNTIRVINFATGQTSIDAGYQIVLQNYADNLSRNPQLMLVVNGHADSRGSDQYNLDLSEKRALQTQRALIALGAPRDQIIIKVYGESQPLRAIDNWDENRRVELDYTTSIVLSTR
jgi:peptidoglycan-associated lipoprotein